MRVCVLHPSYEGSDSPMASHDPPACPERYSAAHTFAHAWLRKATAVRDVRRLAAEGHDVFLNLCDGAADEDRAGLEVVRELERLNLPFTGAGSAFYEPSRAAMKRACASVGVLAPAGRFVGPGDDPLAATAGLAWPRIVKHPSSYSSVGMGADARVEDEPAFLAVVARTVAAFGAALVEEFIAGREFVVLVAEPDPAAGPHAEPRTWPPVEFLFPPGESFKHFDLKWKDHAAMSTAPVADAALAARLQADAAAFFRAVNGSGYGRVDVRLDREGRAYTLEINPNCGLFYAPETPGSADAILAAAPGGAATFLDHILACALARAERNRPRTRVVPDRAHGESLVAARAFAPGDVVQAWEGQPHPLVTRGYVERTWGEQEKAWFAAYAWPISDDVFVTWSPDPEAWQPLNHACDPNTWMRGLDLVARRPIAAGEPITVDYATFCGPTMAPFTCRCGAAACRGTIRGTDHALPELAARYGDHVSPWVLEKRRQQRGE